MRLESFRTLLSIAAWFDLHLQQFDVSAAYLYGDIDGEVYMEPPPGHEDGDSVWKLLKGLYGLKQAGRSWHERLKADMEELGYVQCQRDHAVFKVGTWKKGDWAVCAFWVDDVPGIGSPEQLVRVANTLVQILLGNSPAGAADTNGANLQSEAAMRPKGEWREKLKVYMNQP
jgi:hypothetical protein